MLVDSFWHVSQPSPSRRQLARRPLFHTCHKSCQIPRLQHHKIFILILLHHTRCSYHVVEKSPSSKLHLLVFVDYCMVSTCSYSKLKSKGPPSASDQRTRQRPLCLSYCRTLGTTIVLDTSRIVAIRLDTPSNLAAVFENQYADSLRIDLYCW